MAEDMGPLGALVQGYQAAQERQDQAAQAVAQQIAQEHQQALEQQGFNFKQQQMAQDQSQFDATQAQRQAELQQHADQFEKTRQDKTDLEGLKQQNRVAALHIKDQDLAWNYYLQNGGDPNDRHAFDAAYTGAQNLQGQGIAAHPTDPNVLQPLGQYLIGAHPQGVALYPGMPQAPTMSTQSTPQAATGLPGAAPGALPVAPGVTARIADMQAQAQSRQAYAQMQKLLAPGKVAEQQAATELKKANIDLTKTKQGVVQTKAKYDILATQERIKEVDAHINNVNARTAEINLGMQTTRQQQALAQQAGGYATKGGAIKFVQDNAPKLFQGLNSARHTMNTLTGSYRQTTGLLSSQTMLMRDLKGQIDKLIRQNPNLLPGQDPNLDALLGKYNTVAQQVGRLAGIAYGQRKNMEGVSGTMRYYTQQLQSAGKLTPINGSGKPLTTPGAQQNWLQSLRRERPDLFQPGTNGTKVVPLPTRGTITPSVQRGTPAARPSAAAPAKRGGKADLSKLSTQELLRRLSSKVGNK